MKVLFLGHQHHFTMSCLGFTGIYFCFVSLVFVFALGFNLHWSSYPMKQLCSAS